MMEWEPITAEFSPTGWGLTESSPAFLWDNDDAHSPMPPSSLYEERANNSNEKTIRNSLSSGGVTAAELAMVATLPHSDVMLVEENSREPRLCYHVEGNRYYRTLVSEYRGRCLRAQIVEGVGARTTASMSPSAIRSIMEAIWIKDGRFLQYDPRRGVVSIMSNDHAARVIRRDLVRGIKGPRDLVRGIKGPRTRPHNKNALLTKSGQKHSSSAPKRKARRRNAIVKTALKSNIITDANGRSCTTKSTRRTRNKNPTAAGFRKTPLPE